MGQICHHFSWTVDYLLEKPDWYVVQRMLIDAPKYDVPDKENKKANVVTLKEATAEEILEKFNL